MKTERIRVIDRDGNLVETYDRPVADEQPDPVEVRLADLERELRGMKDRVSSAVVTNGDAKKVRDAVVGSP